jgi:hypothetical protein
MLTAMENKQDGLLKRRKEQDKDTLKSNIRRMRENKRTKFCQRIADMQEYNTLCSQNYMHTQMDQNLA